MYLYSASTNGFYVDTVHGSNIPKDSIKISDEEYQVLLQGQVTGKVISRGSNGKPTLTDPVFQLSWQDTQRQAKFALDTSDIRILRFLEKGEPIPELWIQYRESLRNILRAPTGVATQFLPTLPSN